MSNLATLKPFKKGQSGNPAGKPKGTVSLKTKLKIALEKIHAGTGTRNDELLIQAMMKDGIKTDGQSRRMIWQYIEGMPVQDITSGGEKIETVVAFNYTKPDDKDNSDNKTSTKTTSSVAETPRQDN